MLHTVLLSLHVTAGVVGLLVAPIAMVAPKRRRRSLHRSSGFVYLGTTTLLAVTAVALSAYDFTRLAYLAVIAVLTEAAAIGGWWAIRTRPHKRILHLNLLCGSYISFVTAFALVQWGSVLAWVLPTAVGTPLIARATRRELARQAPLRKSKAAASSGST